MAERPLLGDLAPAAAPAPAPARPGTRLPWRRCAPLAVLRRTDALGPTLIVAVTLIWSITGVLGPSRLNPTAFVRFGRAYSAVIQPPPGAVIATQTGYDGQYFWALARDPLLLEQRTVSAFAHQGFRLQRVAYPALAFLLAGGNAAALPWTLLGLNVLLILAITVAVSDHARRLGRSGWWGLCAGWLPGLSFALLADLSDALAVATMLGGVIAWRSGRRWVAAGLLSVAVLAREPMLLTVLAITAEVGIAARAAGHGRRWLHALARGMWPVAVVPVLAFAVWQAYVHVRWGGSTSAPWSAFAPPLSAVVAEIRRALHESPLIAGWDLAYLTLMLAAMGLAVDRVRRHPAAEEIAALLFALILPVLVFGDDMSYTRLSAPLLGCLLLVGLRRRARGVLGVCIAVAALGALVPLIAG